MALVLRRDQLERYMELKGLTPRQIAARAGINYTTLWRAMTGRSAPGDALIAGLLRACPGMDFEDLFSIEGDCVASTKLQR